MLALLFVATLAIQSCQNYLLQGFNEDKVFQASVGQGWRDGHGFTIPVLRPTGFDRVPFVGFPPGYSLLFAAAIGIGRDPFLTGFIVDTAAAAVFCAAWYALLAMLEPGIGRIAGLIVGAYWAVAFSPLVDLPSSDALSLALYSASVAMAIHAIVARRGSAWAVAAGFAAGGAAAVRFAYWPLVVVPALVLVLVSRERRLARLAAYGAPSFAVVLWAALVNVRSSGVLTTVLRPSHAIHWKNFLNTTPFGAEIFGFEVAWNRLTVSLPILAPIVLVALWAVTAFVLAVSVTVSLRDVRDSSDPVVRAFSACTLLTLLVTGALIAGLGAVTPRAADGWTINRDASRYLGPTFPFLMVAVVRAAAQRRRLMALTTIVLLVVGGASVVAYRAGQLRMTLTKNREAYPSGPRTRAWLAALHAVIRGQMDRGRPVLYCDPDLTREYFAIMSGAVAPRGGCGKAERQQAGDAGGLIVQPQDVPGRAATTPASAAPP